MVEALNNPSVCSIFISLSNLGSIRHGSRIRFQCIASSAFCNWKLRFDPKFSDNHGRGVFAQGIQNPPLKPNKAARLEFDSVLKEVEVSENAFSDQELEGKIYSDGCTGAPVETVDEAVNEVYYLEERDEEILSKRILKLSRTNKVRSALALYRSMVFSGLLPNSHACNSLISSLLRNRRLDDALRVFEFVKSSGIVTRHTYSLILKAVANVWGSDKALSMFKEAERDSKTKSCMDTIVYNTMIAIFGKTDDWVQAEKMWRSLQKNDHIGTLITYRLLVCTFVRCGRNELALDAYHEMVRNGLTPANDTMEAIIGACAREGKWDTALDVLQSMLDSDTKPSLTACNALINSLGKASQVELAFKVYDLAKSLGYSPDSYTWNALLGALNRANRHAESLRIFERMRRENVSILNLHIYNTSLMSCQRLGLWDRALQILWQMEASGIQVPVVSYNFVIGACEAARKPKVALQVFDHMVRLNKSPDVFTLLSLIRGCIWGSLWNEMEDILNIAPNGSVYNAAIQGACLRRKANIARNLYIRMRDIGLKPDGKTRALMLQNLPKC